MTRVRKPKRTRSRWVVALAALGILLAVSTFVGWRAVQVREQVSRGRDQIVLAAAVLTNKPPLELANADFESAVQHLKAAEEALRPARDELKWWEPVLSAVGGDAASVLPLVDTALESAIAGQQLYSGLEPLLDAFQPSTGSSPIYTSSGEATAGSTGSYGPGEAQAPDIEDLVAQLRARQPQVRQAEAHLGLALAAYSRIDKTQLSKEMAQSVAEFDTYSRYLLSLHDLAGTLTEAPDLLASLAGLGRSRTYLLLGQNNDELRPTGGFIGTFGLLLVQDGRIVVHRYSSTSDAYLTPPAEPCPDPSPSWWIRLKEPAWGCWDAQWTADFPTLAREAKWFYEQGKNQYAPVDGVIAVDQIAFEMLLGTLGPVQIPSDSEQVSAENFRSRVYLHPNSTASEPHKQFLAALFQALFERELAQIDLARAHALLPVLFEAVAGKHVLFYFEDPDLQALTSLLGMEGAIRTTRGDYLYVVDTSLYDKVYDSVREQIEYDALLNDNGSVNARTVVTWTYSGSAAAKDPAIIKAAEKSGQPPYLLNLTRIYAPGATVWLSMQGDGRGSYFGVEANRLMAGTRVEMAVGARKQVTYIYQVPAAIGTVDDHQIYTLLVQKQPGTRGASLSVRVTLPTGAHMLSTVPSAGSVTTGAGSVTVEFRTQLTVDRTFQVTFEQQQVKETGR